MAVILTVLLAIKLIYVTDSTLNERFESATKKPEPKHKIDAMLDFFVSKILFNEADFIIDKIYAHILSTHYQFFLDMMKFPRN